MKKLVLLLTMAIMMSSMALALDVSRTVSSTVTPGQEVTITLTASDISGDYFALVEETIPSGWTYVSGGNLQGSNVALLLSTVTSSSSSYVLRAPSSEMTSSFFGVWEDATGQEGNVATSTVSVQTTTTGGDGDTGTGDTDSDGFDFSNPLVWVIGGVVLILLIVVGSKK